VCLAGTTLSLEFEQSKLQGYNCGGGCTSAGRGGGYAEQMEQAVRCAAPAERHSTNARDKAGASKAEIACLQLRSCISIVAPITG
jgi:hypothetical protein